MPSANIKNKNYQLFNLAEEQNIYLGYAKGNNAWGTETLIRINPFYSSSFLNTYIPQSSTDTSKFFDSNVSKLGVTSQTGQNVVYIGKVPTGTSLSPNTVFSILPSNEIGSLTLNYINGMYMNILGFNASYRFTDTSSYDYYILNYNQTPVTAIKIAMLSNPQFIGSSNTGMQLAYSLTNQNTYSTILVSGLTQLINNSGNITLYNLPANFSISSTIQPGYFYLLNQNSQIVISGLTFGSQGIDSNGNTYVNFNISNGSINFTSELPYLQTLAIFSENNYYNTINDNNPPNPSYNYLLQDYLEFSVMNPEYLFQVPYSNIFLATPINSSQSTFYTDLGMYIDSVNGITYAKTQNKLLAYQMGFENLFLSLNVEYFLQATSIYRQSFLVYKPQNSQGENCNLAFYNSDSLFQPQNYCYNLGQLFWISNQVPVNRYFLTSEELYKIVL